MGPPQAGIWGLVVARTLCSLRDVEATVHAHILSTGITNSAWQVGTGTRCSGTQVKYAHTRTQGNCGHPSHSRIHGEAKDPDAQGTLESPTQKVGHCHLRGDGGCAHLLGSKAQQTQWGPPSTGRPLRMERLCWLPSNTEGPLLGRWMVAAEQVAEVGPWHLACVTGVVGECLAA